MGNNSTYFNLRRNSRTANVDFDNDEVSTEDIEIARVKYECLKLLQHILDGTFTDAEKEVWNLNISKLEEPIYKPKDKAELSKIINMATAFLGNECDLNWIDVSDIQDMSALFKNSQFNGDISKWDTSSVKNMNHMFYDSAFNGDIRDWDISSVTLMLGMFQYSKFNQDLSNWDIGHVFNTVFMFGNCPIKDEFKPKKLDALIESAFNLRRDSKTSDIEFDSPEISTENILRTELKYRLQQIALKILNDDLLNVTEAEREFFKEHYLEFDNEPFYEVQTNEELDRIIGRCYMLFGEACNLNWADVHKITNMKELFHGSLFTGDISKWDVSHVKDMSHMFDSSDFNGDISNWDVSNVEDMSSMFAYSQFNSDISTWDVSKVENMQYMFLKSEFNQDISNWDVSRVKDMRAMFQESVFNKNISKWDISRVDDVFNMFYGSKFNQDISNWDVSSVFHAWSMFNNCSIKKEFKPKAILNNENNFISESAFNLKKDSKTSKITFDNDEVGTDNISKANLKYKMMQLVDKLMNNTITSEEAVFFENHCSEIEPIFRADDTTIYKIIEMCEWHLSTSCDLNWIVTSDVTDMSRLFEDSFFNGDISKWDVSHVTDMGQMFDHAKFDGDISNWDVSSVTNMFYMFGYSSFNGDISKWDVSNVENMSHMFYNNKVFNKPIGGWDVRRVYTMFSMFDHAAAFNQPLKDWKVKNVEDMSQMFAFAECFNLPIGKWNVSSCTDFSAMFDNASRFNQPLKNWDVSFAGSFNHMFKGSAFKQDISNWKIDPAAETENMFDLCLMPKRYKPKNSWKL